MIFFCIKFTEVSLRGALGEVVQKHAGAELNPDPDLVPTQLLPTAETLVAGRHRVPHHATHITVRVSVLHRIFRR